MIAHHIKLPMLTGCQTVLPAASPLPSVQWLIHIAVSLRTDLAPDTSTSLIPITSSHREDWHTCSEKNRVSKRLWTNITWPCSNSWTKINSPKVRLDRMRWTLPHRNLDRLWFKEPNKSYQWQISGDLLAVLSGTSLKWFRQASLLTRIDRIHLETINTAVKREVWPKAKPLLYVCPQSLLLVQATPTSTSITITITSHWL